jgi:hypothetical protein
MRVNGIAYGAKAGYLFTVFIKIGYRVCFCIDLRVCALRHKIGTHYKNKCNGIMPGLKHISVFVRLNYRRVTGL